MMNEKTDLLHEHLMNTGMMSTYLLYDRAKAVDERIGIGKFKKYHGQGNWPLRNEFAFCSLFMASGPHFAAVVP